jgi:hypothetical protein
MMLVNGSEGKPLQLAAEIQMWASVIKLMENSVHCAEYVFEAENILGELRRDVEYPIDFVIWIHQTNQTNQANQANQANEDKEDINSASNVVTKVQLKNSKPDNEEEDKEEEKDKEDKEDKEEEEKENSVKQSITLQPIVRPKKGRRKGKNRKQIKVFSMAQSSPSRLQSFRLQSSSKMPSPITPIAQKSSPFPIIERMYFYETPMRAILENSVLFYLDIRPVNIFVIYCILPSSTEAHVKWSLYTLHCDDFIASKWMLNPKAKVFASAKIGDAVEKAHVIGAVLEDEGSVTRFLSREYLEQ